MARTYSEYSKSDVVHSLLDQLSDQSTGSDAYKKAMYNLGRAFGEIIREKIKDTDEQVSLVTTAEDADFLGKGIIDVLENAGKKVWLTVFWNQRFKPNKENNISIAPIIKEFHEKGYENTGVLIVIKSIISNSCVVRTNLTHFIELVEPSSIYVVAPVLYKGAIDNLEQEFDKRISKLFQYLYFAIDDSRTDEGIAIPGIGGDVYQRMGWANQGEKNRSTPQIVKERRV